jgi:hypothetical protein
MKVDYIKSQAGQRRCIASFEEEPITEVIGLTRTKELDLKPSARRHSTGISHSVPFTGTRHNLDVWPALAPGTSLILCRVLGLSEDFGSKG